MVCVGLENCGNVPPDGKLHFVYICNALSGGSPCLADGWFGHAPVVGHRYRFRIEHTGSSWKHTLTDKTNGDTATKSIPDGGYSHGDAVWWGGEAYDFNSQLGPKDTSADIHMYWMQYLRDATGSAWQVAHPVVLEKCESASGGSCTGVFPAHFKGAVYDQNYTDGDAINLWTTAH